MQRILQVANIMDRGGVETLLMNIYRQIDRSEVQFDFLTHPFSLDYVQEYEPEILSMGGKVYKAPSFTKHPIQYQKFIRKFYKEHTEYNVIHGHNLDAAAMVYMREAKKAGRYLIAHSHNINDRGGIVKKFVLQDSRALIRRYPNHFFACSDEAARFAFGDTIADSRDCEILYNGIDTRQYRVDERGHRAMKERLFPNVTGPVFGNVGRLADQKNHMFLLDVFAAIKCSAPDAVLCIIGKGGLEEKLKKRSAELGILSSVHFLGSIPNVPDYLKAFDVFIFPSLYEGLGMAAVEAQAAGLPTLMSTSVPGLASCTDLSIPLNLSAGSSVWADYALRSYTVNEGRRADRAFRVREAGFDITQIARDLCDFYDAHICK